MVRVGCLRTTSAVTYLHDPMYGLFEQFVLLYGQRKQVVLQYKYIFIVSELKHQIMLVMLFRIVDMHAFRVAIFHEPLGDMIRPKMERSD
jgi:hypothetical protein